MPVLVAPAPPIAERSSLPATTLAHWRLWLATYAQWKIVRRRGDPRLLADAGLTHPHCLAREECRRRSEAVRHFYWML
ncbi:putative component of type VI protein secretion system [Ensifer sp. WSM1721]